jgi:prepilin-type N-terminal cleavage/methylation domain-containing protein
MIAIRPLLSVRARKRRARNGFTLVETIIAIVVLATAIPPMLWAIREAQAQRVNPMMASKARWLAQSKLEDIIADRHASTREWAYVVNANYATENNITDFPGFTRSVNIVERNYTLTAAGTGYKVVTVTVSWTDAFSVSRSLSIATVVTDYTPL